MQSLRKKKQYFNQERIAGASKAERRAESARDLLGTATRVREAAIDESYKSLVAKRTNGKIVTSTADPRTSMIDTGGAKEGVRRRKTAQRLISKKIPTLLNNTIFLAPLLESAQVKRRRPYLWPLDIRFLRLDQALMCSGVYTSQSAMVRQK